MKERQQNSSTYPIMFLLVSSTDHVAPVTGLGAAPVVTVSKNGGAFAAAAGTVSEIGSGWYKVAAAGLATDLNTLGPVVFHATGTGADPTDSLFTVVPWNPFDGNQGMTGLSGLAAPAAAGGLPTVGTGAGQINPSGTGKVPATLAAADVTGNVAADLQTIKTQAITCAAGVTVLASVGTAATSTAQTGDAFVRLGAPAGASIAADIATKAASAQIPANFTSATFASAGVFAAAALANTPSTAIATGTVLGAPAPTTTALSATFTGAGASSNFASRGIYFLTGALAGMAYRVLGDTNSSGTHAMTFGGGTGESAALAVAPSAGDTFVVIS